MSFPGGAELFKDLGCVLEGEPMLSPSARKANKNEMDGCGTDIASL